MMRVTASAPGKLVLLGEYAVLEGAPALVLAVNRRATATLTTIAGDAWEIVAPTLGLQATLHIDQHGVTWPNQPPTELAWIATLLDQFEPARRLPACHVELDSDAFYFDHGDARAKLGLGSSAALTVALLGALHACAQLPPPTLLEGIRAHRAAQHGRGSGIDIAASLAGGLSRFQLNEGHAPSRRGLALPEPLHWCCSFTGRSTSTGAMLARVAAWRDREPAEFARRMHELATISSRGIDAIARQHADLFLSSLHDYANALAGFGEATGVDIASDEHRAIGRIAADCGAVYKSCGAGGGDVGITFAVDDMRLREFSARALRAGFPVIGLEKDPKGLEVASTV